jgi:hypothetical protein
MPLGRSPLPMQLFSDDFVAYCHRLVEYSQADLLLLDACREPTTLRLVGVADTLLTHRGKLVR